MITLMITIGIGIPMAQNSAPLSNGEKFSPVKKGRFKTLNFSEDTQL